MLFFFFNFLVLIVLQILKFKHVPAGKIAEKAVCMSVFLTIWHCILMPIQQKLTPPVLLFCDFAGWGLVLFL